jgi:Oxygenase domain of the 2OGFeDO superfamily
MGSWPERQFMKDTLPVRHLVPAMSEDEAIDLTNRRTLLTRGDVDHVATSNEIGRRPDGEPLYVLIKNAIPIELCMAAFPTVLRAASDPVIGGPRAVASGAYMERRTRKDGVPSNYFEVPFMPHLVGAKNGIMGFFDKPQCRLTEFSAHHWEQFQETLPLVRKVNEIFRTYLPERFANQAEAVSDVDEKYIIPGTVFSTITVNLNFPTACHLDEGDFERGFGALILLSNGEFWGGELAFPRYRVAVDYRMGDVLLCDVHEVHGNLPIRGFEGEYVRLSLVLYLRAAMLKKCPAEPRNE